jgi:membrane protein YdbS with pleckstrin-like domain
MERIKKIIMYISGPVVLFVEVVALFIHLFTATNTKSWMVGGFVIFMVVFVPLYSVEYFRQNFKNNKSKNNVQFKKEHSRTEWEGGNIHGKTPTKVNRPGKIFNN